MASLHVCPSYLAVPGAQLLGIVEAQGSIAWFDPALPLDASALAAIKERPALQSSVRLSGPCAEKACKNWRHARCDIAARLPGARSSDGALAECGIRATCRWFEDRGADACASCSLVVRQRSVLTGAPYRHRDPQEALAMAAESFPLSIGVLHELLRAYVEAGITPSQEALHELAAATGEPLTRINELYLKAIASGPTDD